MAYSKTFDASDAISVAEYVDWVDSEVDVFDPDSLWESAYKLNQLASNTRLFEGILSSSIEELASGCQPWNPYTDCTYVLASRFMRINGQKSVERPYFLRANVWIPPRPRAGSEDWETMHYSYQYPHDHNFDFLTVGYFGTGYRTEIFEYDGDSVAGFVGEKVDISPLEDTFLTKNKVMYFRKSKDIHIQYPPEDMSISLNLMIRNPSDEMTRQGFSFDIGNGVITKSVPTVVSRRAAVIDLAARLCGLDVANTLKDIALKSESPQLRVAAFSSMLRLLPNDSDHIRALIAKDKLPFVRELLSAVEVAAS